MNEHATSRPERGDRAMRRTVVVRGGRQRGGRAGRLAAPALSLVMVVSGCSAQGAASSAPSGQAVTRSASPAAQEVSAGRTKEAPATAPPTPSPPAADAAIPSDPSRLARSLTTTSEELRRAVDAWLRDDRAKGKPPEPVVLLALYQQRVYRHLARDPGLASRTYAKLSGSLAAQAKDNVTAIRDLLTLVRPIKGAVKLRIEQPESADVLLRHFRRAERRFGVEWEVLAAVMFVETKFGRVRSPSHTGAKGPMQFMPRTWDAYGMGGDVHDTQDAIFGAANYLRASGAPRDYRRALWAYNHSYRYVNAVQLHARQIKRDIRNYYAYYNWQVYAVTTRGDRRLSGPGA
ncbi:Transglycosylase SLT domain-containing protein [Sinosporangium album]|uniref:Transglycosylase SLT domain-containing protein n=2 Tax=Sinosporangium album TaxID=504805 RepID=A0A1G8BCD6_9ACTN|nr:Transglycosylase SLT domain-containing protein [Sinosporangium album]